MSAGALALALLLGAAPSAAPADGPALERLAAATAAQARALPGPVGVWVAAPSPALARAFQTLLLARLPGARAVEAAGPEAAEAQARTLGLAALVRLDVVVEGGSVRARGDALSTWVNFWSGAAPTRAPAPAAALAQAVPADAAALALAAQPAGPPPAAGAALVLLGAPLGRVGAPSAALALGDVDGDGRAEVGVLTDAELVLLAADGRVLARASREDAPSAARPCREAFGALTLAPGRVRAATCRAAGVEEWAWERGGSLRLAARADGPAPLAPGVLAPLVPGLAAFGPALQLGPGPLDAGAPVVAASRAGDALLLVHAGGAASLFAPPAPGAAPTARLEGVGAGSALAHFGGDAGPSLVTTEAQVAPAQERLRVLALPAGGGAAPRWEAPLPAGRALQVAAGDVDADGRPEVAVAVWMPDGSTELLLFRQVQR